MVFEYTQHALKKMAKRKLTKTLVEETILKPEVLLSGHFGRKIAQRRVGGKLLRVVYEEQGNVYIVVTAYYTRPERYQVEL